MDILVNLTLRFDEDTFNKAIDIYEDDWGMAIHDLTQTEAVTACLSAALDHTGEDVEELATRLDKTEWTKLVKGFMDAYCKRVVQQIIHYLNEEE